MAQEICIPEVVKDQQEHAVVVQRSFVGMVLLNWVKRSYIQCKVVHKINKL